MICRIYRGWCSVKLASAVVGDQDAGRAHFHRFDSILCCQHTLDERVKRCEDVLNRFNLDHNGQFGDGLEPLEVLPVQALVNLQYDASHSINVCVTWLWCTWSYSQHL